jgi:hypothetical protein
LHTIENTLFLYYIYTINSIVSTDTGIEPMCATLLTLEKLFLQKLDKPEKKIKHKNMERVSHPLNPPTKILVESTPTPSKG